MRRAIAAAAVAAVAAIFPVLMLGQQPEPAAEQPEATAQKVEVLHTEIDAVGWAFDALLKYQAAVPEDLPYIRFVALPGHADAEWIPVVDLAVNLACNHGSVIRRADQHANGYLLAYNFRLLVPNAEDRSRVLAVWDAAAVRESKFHVPAINQKEGVESAVLAPHLGEALAKHISGDATQDKRVDVLVTQLTESTGGIYPAEFVIEELLTSLRGHYPEYRLIDFNPPKHTPLQAHLAKRGFFIEAAQDRRGDRAAWLNISDVTGKARIIVVVYGLGGGLPLVITYDPSDDRIRPGEQFVRNLAEFDPFSDASEIFVPQANGLYEYLLTNADGEFQRAAPDFIVADYQIPDGHTCRLEMGMSCVVCHLPDDHIKTRSNDFEKFAFSDLELYGNGVTYKNRLGEQVRLSAEEAVDLLVSRYGRRIDTPEAPLGRARRDIIGALMQVYPGYQITADGPTVAQHLGQKLKAIHYGYRYGRYDADRLCLELGVRVPAGEGLKVLRQLIPPQEKGERRDPLIGLALRGLSLKRDDVDAIYVDLARAALPAREAMKGNQNGQ